MAVSGKKRVAGSKHIATAHPSGRRQGHLAWLGMEPLSAGDIVRKVEAGFSFKQLERFQQSIGLPMDSVADLVRIKPRTLARRKESGRLLPEESDRLVAAAR